MHPLIEELYQYHKTVSAIISLISAPLRELETKPDSQAIRYKIINGLYSLRNDAESAHHFNEELIRHELLLTDAPIHRKVEQIAAEHEVFDQLLTGLLSASIDQGLTPEGADRVKDYLDKYQDHMGIESTIFFPMAEKWLSPQQWERVQERWVSIPSVSNNTPGKCASSTSQ